MKAAIVIHIYKPKLNEFEIISVRNCIEVLNKYPIKYVAPLSLDISWYSSKFKLNESSVLRFENKYFKCLKGYNRLMTSLKFFHSFIGYDYILIHHADAWVFRDELDYWCKKGYDYIGAPIYEYDGTISPPDKNYIGVGNGGFSLHKVSSAIKVLTTFKQVYHFSESLKWWRRYNWKGRLYYFVYLMRIAFRLGGNAHYWLNYIKLNEDIFWGKYVPESFPDFRVAPFEEAYKFSMEYNAEKLINLNKEKLPFGTHQWYKGDFYKFWAQYLPQN